MRSLFSPILLSISLILGGAAALANPEATSAINTLRAERGLQALAYSPTLEKAARRHAMDMGRKGFFSHKGSDGSNVAKRTRKEGYRWCMVAENIAMGQSSLGQVMRDWAGSPSHYKNMVHPKAQQFAVFEGPNYVWVMVVAATGC